MRALLQRVTHGSVSVGGKVIGETGPGLVILACAMQGDTAENVAATAKKIVNLRIFKDDDGRMNRSLLDTNGGALIISQFTLAADTSRGNRPGFSAAAPPDVGEPLYDLLCETIANYGVSVGKGQFGGDMQVSLTNDGPVTIMVEK
ncbi:D-aminoacyl-tRNA deacylase [Amylibacter sp. IMCC11727]|uniref:D-aminoacyl-tRNA deacylase n=1 Tax=Amylibacter sp. IMCC11727 TaxID=3039851 RepID=UPI00244E185E|nr:D-aminoacyl-tRNA deacylase [Amylibacter sp. IMCC11727]WGI22779.1 D-aminoacyl-tRNA deacylase [Amylibacter sp. IMCC11727]